MSHRFTLFAMAAALVTVACSPASEANKSDAAAVTTTAAAVKATPAAVAAAKADAAALAAAEPLPTALTQWLQDARDECERGGGTFRDGDYWQAGDFNRDGRPDFLVTRAALGCDGNDIFSGGTRGDTYELLVSGAKGYGLAEGGILAHDAKVVERAGRTIVLTPDHDDPKISHQWAWDGSKLAVIKGADQPR